MKALLVHFAFCHGSMKGQSQKESINDINIDFGFHVNKKADGIIKRQFNATIANKGN